MNEITSLIPEMRTGEKLMECMREYPNYSAVIREKSNEERLIALSDIYDIYIPSQMSVEIYHKLYMGLMRSLQKKGSMQAVHQQYEKGDEHMNTPVDENELLSIEQLCDRLFISVTTAYKLLQSGEIKAFKVGTWKIPVKSVNLFPAWKISQLPIVVL